ncbi:MAG: tRNA (guanosine(37)-N1)-methyltransferase TrmD [Planctomycetes bacterium]|nr:tRNA (guanosine(37)-N1)-methyltransferase TrmD [Planctomycetota bacterium]
MVIDVITLFPGMFKGFLKESIIKRAQAKRLVKINLHDLRDFSTDKHHKVDDRPFGGGPGMLLLAEPIVRAFEYLKANGRSDAHKIVLTPAGKTFGQPKARALSKKKGLIILCGHYEGFDQRIFDIIKFDDIISIGRYVLSGGELPSMVVMDSVIRLIPGVLGNASSAEQESFSKGNELDYPQYTRPRDFRGHTVPEVLVSGNHQQIEKWRKGK